MIKNIFTLKNFVIIGLSVTGESVYNFLKSISKNTICYDDNISKQKQFMINHPEAVICNINDIIWSKIDFIVISPGIHKNHYIYTIAKLHNISIISDIDLLYTYSSNSYFIGITGTNGKSTTTSLIAHIIKSNNIDFEFGGNIGTPALNLPINKPGYILELSSFQLELTNELRTNISILLNITKDHLDYHLSMENYINAKKRLLSNLTNKYNIIGIDNDITINLYQEIKNDLINSDIQIIPISSQTIIDNGISVIDYNIYDNYFDHKIIKLPINKHLQGVHNQQNIAASYAACKILQLKSDDIINSIASFIGLKHRMQYIGNINDIYFYNDSKATNSDAAIYSINALDNIYWLAGGIAKSGGIENLKHLFYKIKKAYLFGKDKNIFAQTLASSGVDFRVYDNIYDAFNNALNDAMNNKNDTPKNVLLAPSASSLDQFDNFENRGNVFIKLCESKILCSQ